MIKRLFPVATLAIVMCWLAAFGSIAAPLVFSGGVGNRNDRDIDVIDGFYGAINRVIESEEVLGLDVVLDDRMIDPVRESSGLDAWRTLEQQIARFRELAPDSRLEWTVQPETPGTYLVNIDVHPDPSAGLGGLLIDEDVQVWPPFERLRVSGGKIVERDYELTHVRHFETVLQQDMAFYDFQGRTIEVNSLILDPRSEFKLQSPDSNLVILVDAETVSISPILEPVEVRIFGMSRQGEFKVPSSIVRLEEPMEIRTGSAVVLGPWSRIAITNSGNKSAHVTAASFPHMVVSSANPEGLMRYASPMLPPPTGIGGVQELWTIAGERYENAEVNISVVSLAPGATVHSDPDAILVMQLSSSDAIQLLTDNSRSDSPISYSAFSIADDELPAVRTRFGTAGSPTLLINAGEETETVWLLSIDPGQVRDS